MDKETLKSALKNGEKTDKHGKWYKINITVLKECLSGKKYKDVIDKLRFYNSLLGNYYWIYDDKFDDWFNDVWNKVEEQREAPTDSPIETSDEVGFSDRVNKRFNLLTKDDNQTLKIDEVKKYFVKPEEYNAVISLTTKQSNNTYRLKKSNVDNMKTLIQQHQQRSNERIDRIKDEGKREAEEIKNKEINELKEKHNTEMKQERKQRNEEVAKIKNKYAPATSFKPLSESSDEDTAAPTAAQTSQSIKNFIHEAYLNGDYKLGKDELVKRYKTAKYKQILKDANVNDVVNNVMLYSELETQKKKSKLAQLAQIGAFSPESMSNMSPEVQQEINDAIIDESRRSNALKRLRYKLPINKPKARAAMINRHINPMVFRGAYSTGNY